MVVVRPCQWGQEIQLDAGRGDQASGPALSAPQGLQVIVSWNEAGTHTSGHCCPGAAV